MINFMNHLVVHYKDRPHLTGELADYMRSDNFKAKAEKLDKDMAEKIRLTIALLENISLNPLQGTRLDDFFNPRLKVDTRWLFLSFDRITNFVGALEFPSNSHAIRELTEAIEANLASTKFRHAQAYRRSLGTYNKRCSRIRKIGQDAYTLAYKKSVAALGYTSVREGEVTKRDNLNLAAENAHLESMQAMTPHRTRLDSRIQFISKGNANLGFNGSYTEVLENLIAKYVMSTESVV